MTLGSSVTKNMVLGFVSENSHVFLDNYFNSLPLLADMENQNVNVTGTIRSDRIENVPLKDLKNSVEIGIYTLKDEKSETGESCLY